MDLRKTRIGKISTPLHGTPQCRGITSHRIGRQIKNISVTTSSKNHTMCRMPFNLTCDQISYDNTPCFPIHDNDIEHFMPVIHFHLTCRSEERRVGKEW